MEQSNLVFSIDKTYRITDLVSEWFPDGRLQKVYNPFQNDSIYEEEIMSNINMMVYFLSKY